VRWPSIPCPRNEGACRSVRRTWCTSLPLRISLTRLLAAHRSGRSAWPSSQHATGIRVRPPTGECSRTRSYELGRAPAMRLDRDGCPSTRSRPRREWPQASTGVSPSGPVMRSHRGPLTIRRAPVHREWVVPRRSGRPRLAIRGFPATAGARDGARRLPFLRPSRGRYVPREPSRWCG
jgi:hypothetical protein